MIIEETVKLLHDAHGEILASERLERLVIGAAFTAVRLSGGSCGIARTELAGDSQGPRERDRDPGPFAPGRLRGKSLIDVLEHASERPLFDSVKVAALNAVSARIVAASGYRIEAGRDPVEWVDTSAGNSVILVGAFPTYMETLAERPCQLRILELDAEAVPERYRRFFVPAERAAEVLPSSDAVLLTGATVVNRTLDDLLALIPPRAFAALVGPSGGLLPDILFGRGVDVIGTIRVLDPDMMFTIISEGGMGYHLFGTCAEKICIFPK